jgi:hypothetical protein
VPLHSRHGVQVQHLPGAADGRHSMPSVCGRWALHAQRSGRGRTAHTSSTETAWRAIRCSRATVQAASGATAPHLKLGQRGQHREPVVQLLAAGVALQPAADSLSSPHRRRVGCLSAQLSAQLLLDSSKHLGLARALTLRFSCARKRSCCSTASLRFGQARWSAGR